MEASGKAANDLMAFLTLCVKLQIARKQRSTDFATGCGRVGSGRVTLRAEQKRAWS